MEEENGVVTELQPFDVLLGRGSGPNDHDGNIRFRQLVAERKDEYLATNHRQTKAKIAQEIVDSVYRENGRFLKKIEAADARRLGLAKGAEAWVMVDEDTVMEKAKQALRQNTAKPPQERRSVSPKRGTSPNARGQSSPKRNQSPSRGLSPQPQRSPILQQLPLALGRGSGHQMLQPPQLDDFDPLPLATVQHLQQQQQQQQFGAHAQLLQAQIPATLLQAQMGVAGWPQQMQPNVATLGGWDGDSILPTSGNMNTITNNNSNNEIQDWGHNSYQQQPQQQQFGISNMAPPQPRVPSVTISQEVVDSMQRQVVDSMNQWSQHSQQQQQQQSTQDGNSDSEYEEDLDVPLVVGGQKGPEDGLTSEQRRKRRQSLQMEDLMDSFSQMQAGRELQESGKFMGESTDTMGTIDQIAFDNSTTMMSMTSIGSNFSMFTSPMGESSDSMFPSRGVSRSNSRDGENDMPGFRRQGTGTSTGAAPFRRKGTDSSVPTGDIARFRRQGTPQGGAAFRQARGGRGGSSGGVRGSATSSKSGTDDPSFVRQLTDSSMASFASNMSSLGDIFGSKRSSLLDRLVNEEKQRSEGGGNSSAELPGAGGAGRGDVAADLSPEPRPVELIEEDPDNLTSLGKSSMSVMNAAFGSVDSRNLGVSNNPNDSGSNIS